MNLSPYVQFPEKIETLGELSEWIKVHCLWQEKTHGSLDIGRCQDVLDRYCGADREDVVTFSDKHYTRSKISVAADDGIFDMRIIGWSCNQTSGIHDHAEQGCIFKVLQGSLTEKRYIRDVDRSFALKRNIKLDSGTCAYISNSLGYHDLGNTDVQHNAVSLHIYSPASHTTTFYDPHQI